MSEQLRDGRPMPALPPPALPSIARRAFLALLLADLRVVVKNLRLFVLRTVTQPLLFTFVFAYVFPKTGAALGGRPGTGPGGLAFATILVPGLVAVAVFFQGIQAVALPLTQKFSFTREIDDRVLAPLPIWAVAVGKVTAGAVQGLLAAVVVFPIVLVVHGGRARMSRSRTWPPWWWFCCSAASWARPWAYSWVPRSSRARSRSCSH